MAVTEHVAQVDDRVQSFLSSPGKLLIDGEWVPAASGKTFETINPATEERLAEVAHGEAEDIDRAVRAARRAFDYEGPWRRMSPSARGKVIWRIGDLIEEHADVLAQLESLDNGKPVGHRARRRRGARRGPVPLHGRLADEDPRRRHADLGARRVPLLHAARARRRRRADHPVELPAADGGVEARPGARVRLHGRAQAGRADAALRALPRRAAARGGAPGRASSTSSPGFGDAGAAHRRRTPTSTRSRSPARPRSAS